MSGSRFILWSPDQYKQGLGRKVHIKRYFESFKFQLKLGYEGTNLLLCQAVSHMIKRMNQFKILRRNCCWTLDFLFSPMALYRTQLNSIQSLRVWWVVGGGGGN